MTRRLQSKTMKTGSTGYLNKNQQDGIIPLWLVRGEVWLLE